MRQSELVSQLIEPMQNLNTTRYLYKEVILAALTWPTDAWADRALDWIEQGIELDDELANELVNFSLNKNNNQKSRHRASAIAKRWIRTRDNSSTI